MNVVLALLQSVTLLVELTLTLPLLYLALLSITALAARRRRGPSPEVNPVTEPCFAILIPAHNEASGIASTVRSAVTLDYPPESRAVIVVADNCTDSTAVLARAAGATVFERTDTTLQAKGYALRWLLEQLESHGERYDAYVIVDADSRLAPDFLRLMSRALARGAQVAQGQYRVLNSDASWTSGLRAVAFALFNHLRPLGRSWFGWSAGLKGNGMCFTRAVIERFGWGSFSLTEDVEFHVRLLDAGIHVAYIPAAIVAAEMPTTLGQARTQQARWERGRIDVTRTYAPHLINAFFRHGDAARLDAAMEMMLPPLSLLMGALLCSLALSLALRWTLGTVLGAILLALFTLHVVTGCVLARLSARAYLSLLRLPVFIAWKSWVYLAALGGRAGGAWIRTQRAGDQ